MVVEPSGASSERSSWSADSCKLTTRGSQCSSSACKSVNLRNLAVIIALSAVRSTGSEALMMPSVVSNHLHISSMVVWNSWFPISAVCNLVCHFAAFLHTVSHLELRVSSLALRRSARSMSSVWSAKCTPTMLRDTMMVLWLSRSSRNSLWSWMMSSNFSMLVGKEVWVL